MKEDTIRAIIPTKIPELVKRFQEAFDYPGVELYEMENPPTVAGMPNSLDEYYAWIHGCVDETVSVAKKTKEEGYRALLISSGSDPGFNECKENPELQGYPVVALGWANMKNAFEEVERFSIIMPGGEVFIEATRRMAESENYKFADHIVSYKNIEEYDPIFKGLRGNPNTMKEIQESIDEAVSHGAKGIMLACPFSSVIADELNEYSQSKHNIPTFNPARVGVETAKTI